MKYETKELVLDITPDDTTTFETEANKLGATGWQLVGVVALVVAKWTGTAQAHNNQIRAYFQRELRKDAEYKTLEG
jgi:hypothetical protein